jgi:oligoribonuclease (3'-5' exoribonuclease)
VFRFDSAPPYVGIDPFVLNMHTQNGLWKECAKSATTVAEIEEHLLTVVPEEKDSENKPTLAGSSIHFDHTFLRVHMPRLAKRFSHRHYDVSAVKLFCRSLGMSKPPVAEAHRAKADILESIEHAKACVKWLDKTSYLANVCDQVGQ